MRYGDKVTLTGSSSLATVGINRSILGPFGTLIENAPQNDAVYMFTVRVNAVGVTGRVEKPYQLDTVFFVGREVNYTLNESSSSDALNANNGLHVLTRILKRVSIVLTPFSLI